MAWINSLNTEKPYQEQLEAENASLKEHVAAQAREIERLKSVIEQRTFFLNDTHQQLAESQAREAKLIDLCKSILSVETTPGLRAAKFEARQVLSMLADDSALREALAKQREGIAGFVEDSQQDDNLWLAAAIRAGAGKEPTCS